MINYNPLLMIDFYKAVHAEQYPAGMSMIYSTGTPRMSRLNDVDEVVFFGAQGFAKSVLIEAFDTYFFDRPLDVVIKEYNRVLTRTLGPGTYNSQKIEDLHRLGYLPLAVYTVPEGMSTKIGVPQTVFVNTHPDFAWLTNALETVYSAFIWHIQISAEVGKRYRKIVDKYVAETCSADVKPARMLGDFSMRGQHCPESAMTSSAAWLLSFLNTATVPAIMWLEDYYNCDIDEEDVGFGAISTEHSVMCSNYAIDGDEITHIKRLLTEIYPNNNFSMVSDSYDYWNLVDNILPQCKDEILAHNGTLLIRGDSGDPVDVVVKTVFHLWDQFGGTVNEKGYKVLDSHIRAIYGDSITPQRANAIYLLLRDNGFAANNVVLGVGSFSFMCLEEFEDDNVNYKPYTRDTFGYAIKATYGEDAGCNPVMIQKQPKGASWKKSQKGCVIVAPDGQSYTDGHTFDEAHVDCDNNLLQLIFSNSTMVYETSLWQIRQRMYPNGGF